MSSPIIKQKVFNAISNAVFFFFTFLAYGNKRNEYILVPKKNPLATKPKGRQLAAEGKKK